MQESPLHRKANAKKKPLHCKAHAVVATGVWALTCTYTMFMNPYEVYTSSDIGSPSKDLGSLQNSSCQQVSPSTGDQGGALAYYAEDLYLS